jgi:glycosyltransferase involved in cell wall biosynthesis
MPLEKGILLWAKHMSGVLRHTQGKRRVVVDYDRMLESPSHQIERIANVLSLPLDESSRQRLDLYQNEFISRGLRHHTVSLEELGRSELIPGFVKEAYAWVLKLAKDEVLFGDVELEAFWQRFEEWCRSFNAGFQYMDRLELSFQQQEAAADFYKDENRKLSGKFSDLLGDLVTARQQLVQANKELEEHRKLQQQAIAERDGAQKSYHELHQAHNKAVAERDEVQRTCQAYAHDNALLRNQMVEILTSHSWRLTGALRAIRRHVMTRPHLALRRNLSNVVRAVWRTTPVRPEVKSRLKKNLFLKAPFLFQHTVAYRDWLAVERRSVSIEGNSPWRPGGFRQGLPSDEKEVYVPLRENRILNRLPVRLIAFYLPQFHAIPENDRWWGKGFTEWSNVKPAEPQFEGHYQPRLPGELGYYDLSDPSVQKRQVELAKQYGVGGFCFYFYWFAGKRLLETPILNYLNDASLDLPFCLCWANENWSRRWDGLDSEILIAQEHSPDDDIAFIEYVARYLRDTRYIRIDGRPLLLVYRPSLLPNAKETARRWRQWCRDNGIGEIYLAYTQSFETVDPEQYGLDAAIEFPPNNSGPPNVTNSIETYPGFSGVIYDWRVFPERSRSYAEPGYTLFRAVNTAWDNTARRKKSGAIFLCSTPEGYKEWLLNAVDETMARFKRPDERLVFVNAWNEWAEGAHLEPDQRYGYAYLQATRDAITEVEASAYRRIVLVGHDAHPHGAQTLLLYMARMLVKELGFRVDLVLLGDGPLLADYEALAKVHRLHGNRGIETEGRRLAALLYADGIRSAIANTAVSGHFAALLKQAGFTVVSLIHELPGIIEQYRLQSHVAAIADNADHVVFPAQPVMEGFQTFSRLPERRAVVRPQGLYKKNSIRSADQVDQARRELRERFGLSSDALIVLGVGYADLRKGIDLYVEVGMEVIREIPEAYFIWVGNFDSGLRREMEDVIRKSGLSGHFIFPGYDADTDRYYAGADIYALTSREDPFPSVVMEAMDVALPVVAFEGASGLSDLLRRGCGLLVPAFHAAEYAGALVSLLRDAGKAGEAGKLGKEIVETDFPFRRYLFDLVSLENKAFPRVSVVVPNYNYANYLESRINSVVRQNHPIYELIILDDASTDESLDVIHRVTSSVKVDVRLAVNEANTGSPFAQWCKGVKLARGDLVWIAEADDLCDPDFLEELINPFRDESVVLSYCQSMQMAEGGEILCPDYLDYVADISDVKWTNYYVNDGHREIRESLAVKNTIPNVSGVVFRRSTIEAVLNDHLDEIEKYRVAGDWLTYVYVLSHGKVAFSPRPLNWHRRHRSGVTLSKYDISQLEEIMAVQKTVRESFCPDRDIVNKAKSYSGLLYKQFRLNTSKAPTIDRNERLSMYVDNAG